MWQMKNFVAFVGNLFIPLFIRAVLLLKNQLKSGNFDTLNKNFQNK